MDLTFAHAIWVDDLATYAWILLALTASKLLRLALDCTGLRGLALRRAPQPGGARQVPAECPIRMGGLARRLRRSNLERVG